jgi:hypothetical protein
MPPAILKQEQDDFGLRPVGLSRDLSSSTGGTESWIVYPSQVHSLPRRDSSDSINRVSEVQEGVIVEKVLEHINICASAGRFWSNFAGLICYSA